MKPLFFRESTVRSHETNESAHEAANHFPEWFKSPLTRIRGFKNVWIHPSTALRWCYAGRFATTIFSARQHYSIVATMFPTVATLLQHCYAVFSSKSSLRIPSCNITFTRLVGTKDRQLHDSSRVMYICCTSQTTISITIVNICY